MIKLNSFYNLLKGFALPNKHVSTSSNNSFNFS